MLACLRIATLAVLALCALCVGTAPAFARGVVDISPDRGASGTSVTVTVRGLQDPPKTPNPPTVTYYAQITDWYGGSFTTLSPGEGTVLRDNIPVGTIASGFFASTMGFGGEAPMPAQTITVSGGLGEHRLVVTLYARDAAGNIRQADSGERSFTMYDAGPAHPVSLTVRIVDVGPSPLQAGVDLRATIEVTSSDGDPSNVGVGLIIIGPKTDTPLFLPSPDGKTWVERRIEKYPPNTTKRLTTAPFRLARGTWQIHAMGLVIPSERAYADNRPVVVHSSVEPETRPRKSDPHLPAGPP
jgi:hypothetical protein